MPITTVAVTASAARPDGSLIAGGKFRFLLSAADTENGLIVPKEITATANASGVAVANLWPNSLGSVGTQYRVLLSDPAGGTLDLGSCTVPTSACNLHAILGLGTAPTLDQATVAKLAAQTAAAASSASATQSATSATSAATSATAAAGSATAAQTSATSAANSVSTVATSATNAANSATAAGNSATSASASNTAAGTSATNAASSATAAATSASDALASKNAAATSATNSSNSATNSATSATNSGNSATGAATSATAALASQNAAATSATNASTSAATASTQADIATTQAGNAATSAASAASNAAAVAAATTGNMSAQNANNVAVTGGSINGTSITVKDNVFTLQDDVDPTKQANFQLGSITTATTRAYTLPNVDTVLAGLAVSQTFSNTNVFSSGTNTFGSATGTGTNGFSSGATTTGNTKTVNVGTGGVSGSTTNITVGSANGSTTTMLGSTVIGGVAGNQSLQVNNVASAVNYAQITGSTASGAPLYGDGPLMSAQGTDTNINLNLSGKGTGSVALRSSGAVVMNVASTGAGVGDFINIYPTASTMNWVLAGTDTNIGYTLNTKGTGAFYFVTGGGQQAFITNTASSVNYLNLTGAATGAAPTISAQGSDANIGLVLAGKGTGRALIPSAATVGNASNGASQFAVSLGTGYSPGSAWTTNSATFGGIQSTGSSAAGAVGIAFDPTNGGWISSVAPGQGYYNLRFDAQLYDFVTTGSRQFRVQNTGSAVNYIQATGGTTGNAAEISAQGSDANINLKLTTKGTGVLQFGTYTAGVLSATGYITITDAAGTSRRLLVG